MQLVIWNEDKPRVLQVAIMQIDAIENWYINRERCKPLLHLCPRG